MKNGDLEQAMNHINDKYLEEAAAYKKNRRPIYFSALAAIIVLALLLSVVRGPMQVSAHAIAQATYPQDAIAAELPEGGRSLLDHYYRQSIPALLRSDSGENKLFSPMHEYLVLAILAEITGGASQEEIMSFLGASSLREVEQTARSLWLTCYQGETGASALFASSLWLNEDVEYNQETLDHLAQQLYISSFQGKTGSRDLNKLLSQWMSEQTGGVIEEVGDALPAGTSLALASTAMVDVTWATNFPEKDIAPGVFHGAAGDSPADFMHRTDESETVYFGETFTAVRLPLTGGYTISFLLPEGKTEARDLPSEDEALDFLLSSGDWESKAQRRLHISVPKFTINSEQDMKQTLEALGVSSVFHQEAADFSPLSKSPVTLSSLVQTATLDISGNDLDDSAAADRVQPGESAGLEEADFTLDRPFLFAIASPDGNLLYISIVNQV